MNNKYYQSPEPSWLMRQFWKACGADEYLLRRSTYSDQIKYFCLGGIVVATGVMAAMAGGYAIYTIFEPKGDALDGMLTAEAVKKGKNVKDFIHTPTLIISIVFGLIWGLIIYNIDRFIVTSTGKGDGTEAITGQEFRSAIPRIIMGLIIALTISKPIEIRMFKSEIDAELEVIQDKKFLERKNDVDKIYEEKLKVEKVNIQKWENETNAKYQDYLQAVKILNEEMDGDAGARGYGTEARIKESQKNQKYSDYLRLKNTNDPLIQKATKKIEGLNKEKDLKLLNVRDEVNALDGLLERIKLAHKIAGFWISLFITLLFIVIELTPIFFKMMLIKGPYDYMDDNIRDLARAESGIEIMYNYYEDKKGMEAHKVVNHGAELKQKERLLIIKAQEELNEQIIASWKQRKSKDIQENPGKYINEEE